MALPAVNYTHANENWRQRLVKEKAAAQVRAPPPPPPPAPRRGRGMHALEARHSDVTVRAWARDHVHKRARERALSVYQLINPSRPCVSLSNSGHCSQEPIIEAAPPSSAQDFVGTYDYLVWKQAPTHLTRPAASCKAKYYKSQGGDWSIKDKRIALRESDQAECLTVLSLFSLKGQARWFVLFGHLARAHSARVLVLHRFSSFLAELLSSPLMVRASCLSSQLAYTALSTT